MMIVFPEKESYTEDLECDYLTKPLLEAVIVNSVQHSVMTWMMI